MLQLIDVLLKTMWNIFYYNRSSTSSLDCLDQTSVRLLRLKGLKKNQITSTLVINACINVHFMQTDPSNMIHTQQMSVGGTTFYRLIINDFYCSK